MDRHLLAPLSEKDRRAVLAAGRRRRYAKGEIVFHEGDAADSLHLVVAGHLAVQVSTPDGDRVTLTVLSPGSHVGELSLLPGADEQQRSAAVIALDAAETMVLSRAAFQELCDGNPQVQRFLVDLMAERIRELSARLLEALYLGLDRRLYRCLIDLAEVYSNGSTRTIIPLTQEQLSGLVGGTRASVNQVLQRLLDQRIVELSRGKVIVLDLAALHRKAGANR
jgi:CRP-like cAMP-binding protein